MKKKKSIRKIIKLISFISILTGIIIIRIYVFDMYKIPSQSMSPALEAGDYILVNKMSYGSRVMDWWELLLDKKIEYHWHRGFGDIKKDDIFVFNFPQYDELNNKYPNIYGTELVKRCYGKPGDTLIIKEKKDYNNAFYYSEDITKPDLFPHDSTLNWTLDNYGPLWVPAKGSTMTLTPENARYYKDVLLYDGYKAETRNDSVFLNEKYSNNYTIKYNYYFMKGYNFYGSQDSRYWGFVPQTHVIGKAVLVLFSLDPNEPWYRCFKWGRFLKSIR